MPTPRIVPLVLPLALAWLLSACAAPMPPEEQEALLEQGDQALHEGEVARAEDLYEQVSRAAPGNSRAAFGLGLARLRSGYTAGALESFEAALALDPNNADYAFLRAHTLASQNREEEAIQAFQELLALHPGHARATAEQVDLNLRAGRPEEAHQAVLEGLEASPNSFDLLLLAGQVLERTGAHEDAIHYYEQARLARPYALDPIYGLIEAHRSLDHVDKSRSLMSQFEALRQRQEALDEMARLVEEYPSDPEPARLYAQRLFEEGHLEEAIDRTDRFLTDFPGDDAGGALAIRAAQASALLGRDEHTRSFLKAALSIGERTFDELFTAAELSARVGDLQQAVVAYERCLEVRPEDMGALLGLGKASMGLGDMSHAEVYLKQAVTQSPNDPSAVGALGLLLSRVAEPVSARRTLRHALDLDSGQPEALFGLALLERADGDNETAERHLRQALLRKPDHAGIRALHALTLADLGQCEEAIPEIKQALESDASNRELHISLVNCLENLGRKDEAEEARSNATRILGQAP